MTVAARQRRLSPLLGRRPDDALPIARMEEESAAIYASGHLLFNNQASSTLMARRFDAVTRGFTGDAFPIAGPSLAVWPQRLRHHLFHNRHEDSRPTAILFDDGFHLLDGRWGPAFGPAPRDPFFHRRNPDPAPLSGHLL